MKKDDEDRPSNIFDDIGNKICENGERCRVRETELQQLIDRCFAEVKEANERIDHQQMKLDFLEESQQKNVERVKELAKDLNEYKRDFGETFSSSLQEMNAKVTQTKFGQDTNADIVRGLLADFASAEDLAKSHSILLDRVTGEAD